MSLFPNEQVSDVVALQGAPRRMAVVRERGTRKLLLTVAVLIALWLGFNKFTDVRLLQAHWPVLQPAREGLTVVGTLDARQEYDRNFFKIIAANKTSRVELTNYAWRTIFSGTEGGLFTDAVGSIIRSAIAVDSEAGYAMLAPFVHAGVERLIPGGKVTVNPTRDMPILIKREGKRAGVETATLGKLLDQFREDSSAEAGFQDHENSEGGSASGREVDHGLTVPGTVLQEACPIVLTGSLFTDADMEEHPATVLQPKTYTVHLGLTQEGRSRFYQWSRDHSNESLVFLLKGEVLTAGRLTQTLNVSSWSIGPMRDGEAAKSLTDFVNQSAKK